MRLSLPVTAITFSALVVGCSSPTAPSGRLMVSGQALDADTGEGVPDITIAVVVITDPRTRDSWMVVDEERTRMDGSFELEGPTVEGYPCGENHYRFVFGRFGDGLEYEIVSVEWDGTPVPGDLDWDGLQDLFEDPQPEIRCGVEYHAVFRLRVSP